MGPAANAAASLYMKPETRVYADGQVTDVYRTRFGDPFPLNLMPIEA